ncbi:hypothetical protein [Streptomyces sp. NPDC006285]|uniref:hypothetical protein n=1 Tax=Streptomyces sp. NPDC006285 TaxID=3364742 RepID=UPI0036CC4BCD
MNKEISPEIEEFSIRMTTNAKIDSRTVTEARLINETHRVATRLLVNAVRRAAIPDKALSQLKEFVVDSPRHLHDMETQILWPHITKAAPDTKYILAELNLVYERLDIALEHLAGIRPTDTEGAWSVTRATDLAGGRDMSTGQDGTRRTLFEAAVAVRDGLHEYLWHQESILLPMLRDFITPSQWQEFIYRFATSAPPIGRHLMGITQWASHTRESETGRGSDLRRLPSPPDLIESTDLDHST